MHSMQKRKLKTMVFIIMVASALFPLSTYQTNAEVLYEFLIEYRLYVADISDPLPSGEFKVEFWLLIDNLEYKIHSETYEGMRPGSLTPSSGFHSAYSAYIDSDDRYCTNVFELDTWPNADDKIIPSDPQVQRYCFTPYSLFTSSTRTEGSFTSLTYYQDPVNQELNWLEIRVTILDITGNGGGGSPVPIE